MKGLVFLAMHRELSFYLAHESIWWCWTCRPLELQSALCQSPASAMFSVGNPGFISFSAGQVEHAGSRVVGRCGNTSQWDNGEPRASSTNAGMSSSPCLRHTILPLPAVWNVIGVCTGCSVHDSLRKSGVPLDFAVSLLALLYKNIFKIIAWFVFSLWSGTFATDLLSFL